MSASDPRHDLALLDALFDASPAAIAYLDTELTVRRVNPRLAVEASGGERPHGRPVRELFPELAGAIEPALRGVLRTRGRLDALEIRGRTRSGTTDRWTLQAFPTFATEGDLLGVCMLLLPATHTSAPDSGGEDVPPHHHEARARSDEPIAVEPRHPATGGTETILLVDDEAPVRAMAARVLRRQGYTVLQAGDPIEALRLARQYRGAIHLLLTDVIMPEMGGRELAEQLTAELPALRVVFMSGDTADELEREGRLAPRVHLVSKPYVAGVLTGKVRDVLDGGAA